MFKRLPAMVGHSGASGAVLYYVPELDLYVSGTVNQIKSRSLSHNLMARVVLACAGLIEGFREPERLLE
jgi:hypothetical protein